jgi:cytochrome c-type biogenesis protein CcmF
VTGVTLVKGLETSADVRMQVGETVKLGGFDFRFAELQHLRGPNYIAAQARFDVSSGGVYIESLLPEKRIFTVQKMPMTEAAIDRGFTRDLYLALGEKVGADTWTVRIQHKPFVGWIWAGCLIMAGGGLCAALDRRYRLARKAAVQAAPALMPV